MKAVILSGIAAVAIASSAFAGDLAPPPAPVAAAPVAPSWTGFYLGGNIGAVVESASGTSNFTDTIPGDPPNNPQSNSFSSTGFLGGVQAGYNWQFAPLWVAGIEADWDWANTGYNFCRQTDPLSVACVSNLDGFEAINSKTDWLATLRGRLGVTWGNWLFYGTGGAAWGRVNTTLTLNCSDPALPVDGCGASSTVGLVASSSTSTTAVGWVAGLGAEWMLANNWSLRAEWLHIDLGSITDSLPTAGSSGTQTAVWSRTEKFDEFRFGVNYLFR